MKTIQINKRMHGSRGFTLLELLLSLAITSIVIVIVFGAFRIAIRAWEKSDRDIDKQQRIRVVTQMIRIQLASAVASKSTLSSTDVPLFEGNESQLSFISAIALNPQNKGSIVFSQLIAESGSDDLSSTLFLVEKGLLVSDPLLDTESTNGEERVVLATGLKAIRFHYLDKPVFGEQWDWRTEFNSDEADKLPAAVKIELTETAASDPIVLIIPIRSGTSA